MLKMALLIAITIYFKDNLTEVINMISYFFPPSRFLYKSKINDTSNTFFSAST